MQQKLTYFLSDFHLGASYFENPLEVERKVVGFLDSIKESAKTIYLLGDILDYWYEYRYVVPKGFVRFFGKLAELSDMGIKIYWFIGNHDIWIFDYLPNELGVEVVQKECICTIDGKKFSYFRLVYEKILTLCTLVLLAWQKSLIVGSASMLPDDYENLAQSVVASNVFSNNILSAITTGNYWDVVQDYKPLMHLWYIGILVPFYFIYPAIYLFTIRIARKKQWDKQKTLLIVLGLLTVLSLMAYFLEKRSAARFYYFPFRFYEMLTGCLVAIGTKYFGGGGVKTDIECNAWSCAFDLFAYS